MVAVPAVEHGLDLARGYGGHDIPGALRVMSLPRRVLVELRVVHHSSGLTICFRRRQHAAAPRNRFINRHLLYHTKSLISVKAVLNCLLPM